MVAITLTQDSYRLWARIGAGPAGTGFTFTPGNVKVTESNASVAAQLAQLNALSITNEQY
jgi:hypothetical protein